MVYFLRQKRRRLRGQLCVVGGNQGKQKRAGVLSDPSPCINKHQGIAKMMLRVRPDVLFFAQSQKNKGRAVSFALRWGEINPNSLTVRFPTGF
jgi:hypothetical protein